MSRTRTSFDRRFSNSHSRLHRLFAIPRRRNSRDLLSTAAPIAVGMPCAGLRRRSYEKRNELICGVTIYRSATWRRRRAARPINTTENGIATPLATTRYRAIVPLRVLSPPNLARRGIERWIERATTGIAGFPVLES
ncbi:hypothetical protein DFH06DRAFT_1140173 [Mycena polygramma]|nr:hypothetical protein DFH06DRAFT_1140173 [Mycena polygramma]